MDSNISANDIWLYRNQPYGFWKAGNPLIKFTTILIILIGAFTKNSILMFQGSALCLILLYMPSKPKSILVNLITNFGCGSLIVGSINYFLPKFLHYFPQTEIPYVATIDWLTILSYMIVAFSFYQIRVAITSRDIAWLIDIFPLRLKEKTGAQIYGFIFGLFRWPEILINLKTSILSRGGCSPFKRKICKKRGVLIDIIGIWCLNLMRFIDDMTITVEYVLKSRIKIIDRSNPSKKAWSSVDFSIAGIQVLVIAMPYALKLF